MIRLLTAFALLASASAADVRLRWNPNPEPDIAGYRVYHGTTSGAWITTVDVGNVTEATVEGVPDDRPTYLAITAYNDAGLESIPSEEALFRPVDPRLSPPTTLRIQP